ncbi:MAG: hypothetical protein ACJ0RB_08995 [Candidatus Azotimanducaceae bacterium]
MGQLGLMASYSYGGTFGDGEDNIAAAGTRPEWTLCAFDPCCPDRGRSAVDGNVVCGLSLYHSSQRPADGHGWHFGDWHPSRIPSARLGSNHHDPGFCRTA